MPAVGRAQPRRKLPALAMSGNNSLSISPRQGRCKEALATAHQADTRYDELARSEFDVFEGTQNVRLASRLISGARWTLLRGCPVGRPFTGRQ